MQRRLTDAGCYNGAIDGAAGGALDAAVMTCPDQAPLLRIETGMHTALIRRIGVDASCRRIATASDDKTVRLWSLPDGRLERTIRLPIGLGDDGKLNAVALSPDGRRLAAGGNSSSYAKLGSSGLSLVDLDSGSIRRVGDFPDVIDSIGFFPDGARVAVGLAANVAFASTTGCRARNCWPIAIMQAMSMAWPSQPDGSLIASSFDGQLRRYGPDLRLTAKRGSLAGQRPYGVAIDPAGRRLAVGFDDAPKVSILDATTLAPIAEADADDVTGNLGLFSVAWSRDGGMLMAGGYASHFNIEWLRFLRRFDPKGRRRGADIPISSNTVMDIRPCGEGFAYAAADPAFGLASAGGMVKVLQGPRTADMRNKFGKALEISGDGAIVRFGLGNGNDKPVLFDVAAGSLANSPIAPASLAPARVDGLPVTDWKNSYEPKFKDIKIGLDNHETARSLAVRPDRVGFRFGAPIGMSALSTRRASRYGNKWLRAQPGASISARTARSSSSPMATARSAGCGGRTAWNCSRCSSTFRRAAGSPGRRPAITWHRPGGEDLIGWHLNRGWTQEADFFPASRFSARFNRPDIVQLVLKTHDEAAAVDQANEKAKRKQDAVPIETTLPPVIKIVSPTAEGKFSGDAVEVMFTVRSPSRLPIDRVDALIDGRPVEARGVAPAASQTADSSGETRHLTIPAPAQDFELALIAHSGTLVGEAARVRLVYAGAPTTAAAVLKSKLYAVTIGVSDYADPLLRLGYAADDARGFAEVLQKQKGGLFGDVQVKTLLDGAVTRTSVVEALEWLEEQVTSRDFGVVLIAGHGVTDEKQRYWFLPADASLQHLRTSAVSQDDIQRTMGALAGKAILFLDTCHANAAVAPGGVAARGPVDMNSLVNEFAKTENGVVTFAHRRGARPQWNPPPGAMARSPRR